MVWFGLVRPFIAELIYFVFVLVTTRNFTVIFLHFANFTNFFLSIWKAVLKQFNFAINHKSSGKMESVTMDVVTEENQERCLEIQDQASKEVGRGKSLSFIRELKQATFLSTRTAAGSELRCYR